MLDYFLPSREQLISHGWNVFLALALESRFVPVPVSVSVFHTSLKTSSTSSLTSLHALRPSASGSTSTDVMQMSGGRAIEFI